MEVNMHTFLGSTGIKLEGVCPICDGDGELATTDRAAYHPDKYPSEMVKCTNCKGLGGSTKEAGEKGRKMSKLYLEVLTEG